MNTGQTVPIDSKLLLTLEEAAAYTGLGVKKFREVAREDPDFAEAVVCVVGRRRLFKRRQLDEFVDGWAGCEL